MTDTLTIGRTKEEYEIKLIGLKSRALKNFEFDYGITKLEAAAVNFGINTFHISIGLVVSKI
jgi:hypothetical protein